MLRQDITVIASLIAVLLAPGCGDNGATATRATAEDTASAYMQHFAAARSRLDDASTRWYHDTGPGELREGAEFYRDTFVNVAKELSAAHAPAAIAKPNHAIITTCRQAASALDRELSRPRPSSDRLGDILAAARRKLDQDIGAVYSTSP